MKKRKGFKRVEDRTVTQKEYMRFKGEEGKEWKEGKRRLTGRIQNEDDI